MNKLVATLAILLSIYTLASALKCYDCDPDNGGTNCTDPVKHNIRDIVCGTRKSARSELTGEAYVCVVLYLEAAKDSSSKTGVFRGCSKKTTTETTELVCDSITINPGSLGDGVKGNVTKCSACEEDRCNKELVGGASSLTISLLTVVGSMLGSLYVSHF